MGKFTFLFVFLLSFGANAASCLGTIKETMDFLRLNTDKQRLVKLTKHASEEVALSKGLDYLASKKAFETESFNACCQTGEEMDKTLSKKLNMTEEIALKTRLLLWMVYDDLDAQGQLALETKTRSQDKKLAENCFQ